MLSITAAGWFCRRQYAVRGVVKSPYPIALLGFLRFPYRMPAWSLRPYPSFISMYYSPLGWCYQRRRTWHGMQPTVLRPPISKQPLTDAQNAWKQVFKQAVALWQSKSPAEKVVYEKYRFPVHASGYNRFLSEYLNQTIKEFRTWSDSLACWSDWQVRWGSLRIGFWSDPAVYWSDYLMTWGRIHYPTWSDSKSCWSDPVHSWT